MNLRYSLLILFQLVLVAVEAQERSYNFLHFTEKEGLGSNQISDLAQDAQGLIWISSKKGLSSFDGLRFVDVNLNQGKAVVPNYLGQIAIDQQGRIWMTSNNRGLLCYDRSKPLETSLSSYFARVDQENLIKTELYDVLASRSGLIYFGGQETDLQVLDPKTGLVQMVPMAGINKQGYLSIYGLEEDHDGNIWIGTRYHGLICYSPKTRTAKQLDLHNPGENGVSSMTLTENKLYAGYYDHDLLAVSYDMGNVQTKLLNWGPNKAYYDNFANTMAYWPEEKEVLIGHNNRGLDVYSINSGKVQHITWSDLMPGQPKPSRITAILPIKGGYWIGTESGLFLYSKRLHAVSDWYPKPAASAEPILSLFDWNEERWFRTENQFGQLSADYKTRISSYSLQKLKVSNVQPIQDRLLISTFDQGVWYFDKKNRKLSPLPIVGDTHHFRKADCNSIVEDRIDGKLVYWIGSWNSGLYRYDTEEKRIQLFGVKEGLPDHKVITVGKDTAGRIWMGMDGYGVVLLLEKKAPKFRQFKHHSEHADSLASNTVFSFYNDREGRFWFSNILSGIGEVIAKGQDFRFKHYPDDNPFPWLYSSRIKEDSQQLLWLKSLDGVSVVDKKQMHFYQLVPGMGIYPAAHIQTYNYYLHDNDLLWCTDIGLFRGKINTLPFQNQRVSYQPVISSMAISNQDQSFRLSQKNIKLAAAENNFSFSFSVPEQASGIPLKFAFQLVGFDEDWIESNSSQTAYYNNLNGGHYIFKVRVGDRFGQWSEHELHLPIRLASYWYASWWFKLLLAVFILGTSLLFFRYRINQQKKINKLQADFNENLQLELLRKVETIKEQDAALEKQRQEKLEKDFKQRLYESELKAIRSQMNPHFIFNVLNSIEAYVMENDSKNASHLIQKFSSLSRIVLENSQFSLVSIHSEIQLIRLYLELEQERFDYAFDFSVEVDPRIEAEHLQIPSMLIQPLVENAVHHGIRHLTQERGKISIQLSLEGKQVHIWILDNGVGFSKDKFNAGNPFKSTSFGINGIKDRLQVINGQFDNPCASIEFESPHVQPGYRTQVHVLLPILRGLA